MQITFETEVFNVEAVRLALADNVIHEHLRRALYQISGLWKKTSVDYAPISPTTTMLRNFAKSLKSGKQLAHIIRLKNGMPVILTRWYEYHLPMLLDKKNVKNRPKPGGLMRSITVKNTDSTVECFVPANSVAGSYAFKIHSEKGKSWKDRGPGTQAKGPQADAMFIVRAARDQESDFAAILGNEFDKIMEGAKR